MSETQTQTSKKGKRKEEDNDDEGDDSEVEIIRVVDKKPKISSPTLTITPVAQESFFSRLMRKPQPTPILWEYKPRIVGADDCTRYYDVLKEMVNPTRDTLKIFGRECIEHRRKVYFSKGAEYFNYSSTHNVSQGWPDEIEELAKIAEREIGQEFDSTLVNFYESGEDYVSAHSDKDCKDTFLASFSFGATREFLIRDKVTKKITHRYNLESGSLFIMKPGMQEKFIHELPARPKIREGRINVTMRYHNKKRKAGPSS
eukprot:TRINITY_DN4111_c0_g2_i1.p1 TRINITY_DN4111_c0_g2~~TRINITY_DN4111_c0_g2_i1.p1  ORF type:complete len:258 (-),score=56.72 TRINITY_DN4111_c0_g2_i1:88-861(-)